MALLFEKCEVATQSIDCPTTETLNSDIEVFMQQQKQEKRPILSDNEEANELVSG